MKTFLAALLIFCLILGGSLISSHNIARRVDTVRTRLSEIPRPAADTKDLSRQYAAVRGIREEWTAGIGAVDYAVNHEDLMQVAEQFAALTGAAEANSTPDYLMYLTQLDETLRHLSEMAGNGPKNIL